MRHLDARHQPEQFTRQMARRAGAGRGEKQFKAVRARRLDQFTDRFDRQRGCDHHQARPAAQRCDRGKIAQAVVGQLRVERRVDRKARRNHQQRVAIGIGVRGKFAADDAVGAAAVVDDQGLSPRLVQMRADQSCLHVARTTGAEGHDQADRFGRVILCQRIERDRRHGNRKKYTRLRRVRIAHLPP